jgi:GTP-binding protein HflX
MTVVEEVQQRAKPDYTSYLGRGKLEEIVEDMKRTKSGLLIIGNILKPRQIYHINERLRKD